MTEEQVMKDFDLNKGKKWESCWNRYFQMYCKQFDREVWIVSNFWRCFRVDEMITQQLVKEDFRKKKVVFWDRDRHGPRECWSKRFEDETRVIHDRWDGTPKKVLNK